MTIEEWKEKMVVRLDTFVAKMQADRTAHPEATWDVDEGQWDEWFESCSD